MAVSLVLTFIGPDRPGLVEALSRTIAEHDGNWIESRMSHLAGQFAGMVQVAIDEAKLGALRKALGALEAEGLKIVAESSEGTGAPSDSVALTLELVGTDRPGIVREISRALAQHGVNVEELNTECTSAPMSGDTLFVAMAHLSAPAGLSLDALRKRIEDIAQSLTVEVSLAEGDPDQDDD